MKQDAPAASRNAAPILEVLRRVLPQRGLVLEIACGTGQHSVAFARALPALQWQPSDRDLAALASTRVWRDEAQLGNLLEPVELDVCQETWPIESADAIVCINMIHISPWQSCLGLLSGAERLLGPGGVLVLYGPFFVSGVETAPSNIGFDQSLRQRDPSWGLRRLEDVETEAAARGLVLEETVAMPANNLCVIFERSA